MILAWKNIRRFLWCWSLFCCCCCCCCYSFVIFLHSHFLFDIIPHSSVDYCQVFTPILYFQPSPSQSNSRHFHFSTIPLSSYCKCYGFELAFSTHRCFLPHTPSRHFWHIPDILAQPSFIKDSLGAGSYLFESCRASYWSSKHRPGPSVFLIHSNPQHSIHVNFVFMHVSITKVLLVVKTLIRSSAAELFSNHENIKQQPNHKRIFKLLPQKMHFKL